MQKTTSDAADLQQCSSSTSPESKTTRTQEEFSISEPAWHKPNVLRLMSEAVGELKTWPTPRCRVIPLMLQQRRFDSPKQQHGLIF